MATLRMTAIVPDSLSAADQQEVLTDLAGALRQALEGEQRLRRLRGLTLPGAPATPDPAPPGQPVPQDRIFVLEVPDGDDAPAVLRVLGGWLMRRPGVGVALKADGPGGGVSLRLDRWSAVAFAAAVSRVQQQLRHPSEGVG